MRRRRMRGSITRRRKKRGRRTMRGWILVVQNGSTGDRHEQRSACRHHMQLKSDSDFINATDIINFSMLRSQINAGIICWLFDSKTCRSWQIVIGQYYLKGRVRLPKHMKFRKISLGGGSHVQSKNVCCWPLNRAYFGHFPKKLNHYFQKMRGGSKAVWDFAENSSVFVALPD